MNLTDYTELEGKTLKEILEKREKEVILLVLERYHGNQSEVARLLKISRTALCYKLMGYKNEVTSSY